MCFNDIPVEHMRIFHQIVRLVRNDRVVDQRCECGDVIRFMNLHVQQSVHVLAAQTYCQIAVSGGGAVKGVRHLKKMIRTVLSSRQTDALNVHHPPNCRSRWEKRYFRRYSSRDLTSFRGGNETFSTWLPRRERDIDLPSARCQTRRRIETFRFGPQAKRRFA